MINEIVAFHRPQDVVIFIVGGTTYEESRSVALYNAANPGVRFFLGGSVVLNSKRYTLCTVFSWQFLKVLCTSTFFPFGPLYLEVDISSSESLTLIGQFQGLVLENLKRFKT